MIRRIDSITTEFKGAHISLLKYGPRAKHDRLPLPLHYHQINMQLQPTDALLVIDVQNDFMPGGALAVKDGDAIVPLINTLAKKFDHVILTQDWHPPQHISFASTHDKQPFETIALAHGPQKYLKPSGPITSSSTPTAPPFTPTCTSPTPNSSYEKASAATSTATPPSSKTTTPPRLASPATSANAISTDSSSAASPTTSASATPRSTAKPSASKPSSSKTLHAPWISPTA